MMSTSHWVTRMTLIADFCGEWDVRKVTVPFSSPSRSGWLPQVGCPDFDLQTGRSESGLYNFGVLLFQRCELAVGQVAGADQWATFNVSETHGLSHLFPVLKLLGGIVAGHR